jgi:hypothetical protein
VRRLAHELREAKTRYAEQAVQLARAKESTERLEEEKHNYLAIISQMIDRAHFTPSEPIAMESGVTPPPVGK